MTHAESSRTIRRRAESCMKVQSMVMACPWSDGRTWSREFLAHRSFRNSTDRSTAGRQSLLRVPCSGSGARLQAPDARRKEFSRSKAQSPTKSWQKTQKKSVSLAACGSVCQTVCKVHSLLRSSSFAVQPAGRCELLIQVVNYVTVLRWAESDATR